MWRKNSVKFNTTIDLRSAKSFQTLNFSVETDEQSNKSKKATYSEAPEKERETTVGAAYKFIQPCVEPFEHFTSLTSANIIF